MHQTNPRSLFCFGYGYVAQNLARHLAGHASEIPSYIQGTTRDGLDGTLAFGDTQGVTEALRRSEVTHLLISIPPQETGDPVLQHYADVIQTLPALRWVGYLSSTAVYGDHQGEWVTESSKTHPTSPQGIERLKAETQWLAMNLPVHIFRLAGIYGPGRSMIDRMKAPTAVRIDHPGHVFSRIHVQDIIHILMCAMDSPTSHQIYNMSDDLPASYREVMEYICDLMGREYPPLVPVLDPAVSPGMRTYFQESKKVSNAKVKEAFGISLRYPTFREGMAALIKN